MALQVSPTRLRDELTELCIDASAGEQLLAGGVHQEPVLIRRVRRGDRGRRIGLTQFRRRLYRLLREARREPIVITVSGIPSLWVGRDPRDGRSLDQPARGARRVDRL
jgi:hypothetical protein